MKPLILAAALTAALAGAGATAAQDRAAASCTFDADYVFFKPQPGVTAQTVSWRTDKSLEPGQSAYAGFLDGRPFTARAEACGQFILTIVFTPRQKDDEQALMGRLVGAFHLAEPMTLDDARWRALGKDGAISQTVGDTYQSYSRERSLDADTLTFTYWIHN